MKRRGGFNAMDPARAKEIQSKGGKAAQAKGVAPRWNSETGRKAGKKGGGKNNEKLMLKRFGREKWLAMQEGRSGGMADASDLKSEDPKDRKGSTPFSGINKNAWIGPPKGDAYKELVKLVEVLEKEKKK